MGTVSVDMPYGVNRTAIFRACRLNQCHQQHDFDSRHVSRIHHDFFVDIDSIFDDFNNTHRAQ